MVGNSSTEGGLSGLQILNTRPAAQSHKWQALLSSLGAKVVSLPLMEIIPVATVNTAIDGGPKPTALQNIISRVLDLDLYQHVIFISQNAVNYGFPWIDRYWVELPLGQEYYAVGRATAAALKQCGIESVVAGGAMNSEALLALPELADLNDQRVLIFRGVGGRDTLAEVMTSRGAKVDYCELYTRCPCPKAAEEIGKCWQPNPGQSVITVHSGETLSYWSDLINQVNEPQWRQLPVLVPGQRVYEIASKAGFEHLIKAENAGDEAMSRALTEYWLTVNH